MVFNKLFNKLHKQYYLDEEQREKMRAACRFNAQVIDFLRPMVVEGNSTEYLDSFAKQYILDHGHTPACLGYRGYPKSICTSVNEVICHGIPDAYQLKLGDIVNIDCTSIVDGWFGDQSETFLIGEVSAEAKQVTQVAFDSLYLAIDQCQPGALLRDAVGQTIADYAKQFSYGVVEDYQGHGIGKNFHQWPDVPHYPEARTEDVILQPGMCFTVEPMINLGVKNTVLDRTDGWTVRTKDKKLSAQFEHTILITETGNEIMTLTQDGPQKGHLF